MGLPLVHFQKYWLLSVRSKDFRNIVQDYVPYGTNKSEKDTKESIIKASKELILAKFLVLREIPSLFELSYQEMSKILMWWNILNN